MGWKHYQTVDLRNREPQVGRGLFGIPLLILHFKIHRIFNIFLNLTYPLRKNLSFPKCPKIYTKTPNSGQWDKQRDLVPLETWPRYWQKGCVKAGVNMNRREIWSDMKKEIVRIKMGWKHYKTVDPRKREPQVARGLFGFRLLTLHFKFQFSKSIKSSTFHIFLNLTYPLKGLNNDFEILQSVSIFSILDHLCSFMVYYHLFDDFLSL